MVGIVDHSGKVIPLMNVTALPMTNPKRLLLMQYQLVRLDSAVDSQ